MFGRNSYGLVAHQAPVVQPVRRMERTACSNAKGLLRYSASGHSREPAVSVAPNAMRADQGGMGNTWLLHIALNQAAAGPPREAGFHAARGNSSNTGIDDTAWVNLDVPITEPTRRTGPTLATGGQ